MRVLVAGGTGFLGRAFLADLARSDNGAEAEVLVLSRGGVTTETATGRHTVRHIAGSWSEAATDRRILDFAPQMVVNLIGDSHPRSSIGREAREVRHHLLPFLDLIEALEPNGLERVVFSSSAGAIYRSGVEAVEKDKADSAYHSTKRSIEHYLSSRSAATGLRAVSLRISNPIGDLDRPGFGIVGHFARSVARGDEVEFIGDYANPKDYVALEDVAAAITSVVIAPWPAATETNHAVVDVGSGWAIDAPGMYKLIRALTESGGIRPDPDHGSSPLDHGFSPSQLDLDPIGALSGWRPRHDVVASVERLVRRQLGESR